MLGDLRREKLTLFRGGRIGRARIVLWLMVLLVAEHQHFLCPFSCTVKTGYRLTGLTSQYKQDNIHII